MAYTNQNYQEEKQRKFVNPNCPYDSCGHIPDGWCGVCVATQPRFVQRKFKEASK